MTRSFSRPPDLGDIESLAKLAYDEIPEMLREKAKEIVIKVEDFPDRETQRELGLQSPFELMGVYRGVPFGTRSVTDTPQDIDLIILYRRPLLDYWCETQEDFPDLVRHVLIHEIGHHFGFSDEEMERIEAAAERPLL
jgi:predicted Zn-dependent protease with MMP-like domain